MAKDGRSPGAIATLLSLLAMLLALLAGSRAQAQQAVASPSPDGFQRRHQVGAQIGGSGVFQAVYRYRAAGPLAGVDTRSSVRVLRPMAGLAYFYAF